MIARGLSIRSGIIAGVMNILAEAGISVRQVVTDDPDLIDNPRASYAYRKLSITV